MDNINGYRPGMSEEEIKEVIYKITDGAAQIAEENVAIMDFLTSLILTEDQLKALLQDAMEQFEFAGMGDNAQQCKGLIVAWERVVQDPERMGLRTAAALIIYCSQKFRKGQDHYRSKMMTGSCKEKMEA